MKILLATETSGPGGAEQVVINLSVALRAVGHEVEVLMLKSGWLSERLSAEGITVHRIPLRSPLDWRFVREFKRFLECHRYDVLHTHEFTFAFYGQVAARLTGVPMVATAHGANFAKGWKRRALGMLLLRPNRRFRFATVSKSLACELARAFHLRPESIDVIRNGIPIPTENCRLEAGAFDRFRLTAIGNLYPVKNHAALVRIVARLRSGGVPAELDILGRGGEEEALRREIAENELDGIVRLQGFRQDIEMFLDHCDVFVSASLSEQMPISYLEAMARGIPVVGSRVGGVAEIVDDGVQGLLFDFGNEEAAVAHLETLWRDPGKRKTLGAAGKEKFEREYTTERMADAYLGLYGKVAK